MNAEPPTPPVTQEFLSESFVPVTRRAHKWWIIGLIIGSFLLCICAITFNGLWLAGYTPHCMNKTTTGNVSTILSNLIDSANATLANLTPSFIRPLFWDTACDNSLDILPPKWAMISMWAIIFLNQLIFHVYSLSLLWRQAGDIQERLYVHPDLINPYIYVCLCLVYLTDIALFFWLPHLWRAFWCLAVMKLGLLALLCTACLTLHRGRKDLERMGLDFDHWFLRIIVVNGFGAFSMWCFICLQFFWSRIIYQHSALALDDASCIVLFMLAICLMTYFCVDMFVLRKYMHPLYSPYIVMIWYLMGSLLNNVNAHKPTLTRNNILTALLLALTVLLLAIRPTLLSIKRRRSFK